MLYLDTAATTPVDPRVAEVVLRHMTEEFGNAGSRTHEWGTRAKKTVQHSRETIASSLGVQTEEVIFTSGATESNNIALLGLAEHGRSSGRMHIVSSATEHKAVLEPLEHLASHGFEVEFLHPNETGRFETDEVLAKVRLDTLVVSLMYVNNETGVVQPISELAEALAQTKTLFHVDAAQGFGKLDDGALSAPVDLISISGHKIAAPKGIGALITRRRGWARAPLTPLMFGGGQERKLRPGTVPVALVAGLAEAARIQVAERQAWTKGVVEFRSALFAALEGFNYVVNGDLTHSAPHILNLSFAGIDSEALVLATQGVAGIATGSACTSSSYTPSHVLTAMGLDHDRVVESVRLSWWSDSDPMQLNGFRDVIAGLQH